jgi:hypothetical protein
MIINQKILVKEVVDLLRTSALPSASENHYAHLLLVYICNAIYLLHSKFFSFRSGLKYSNTIFYTTSTNANWLN